MSFVWFRKYHKPFLWFAVIFTVVVFATFSGMSDLKTMLSGHPSDKTVGEFKVAGTGETRSVSVDELQRMRVNLNRWSSLMSRSGSVNEDAVWTQFIIETDARAAGLNVADSEVNTFISNLLAQILPPGTSPTKDAYHRLWNQMLQFPSARDFEEFVRGLLLGSRYEQVTAEAAGLVDADEVYLRWRTDNELFDLDAVVIPDIALESVADPSSDVLQAWWDAMPENQRNARFVEPQKQDVVYAWLPLDAGPDVLSDDKLAGVTEPGEDELQGRFEQDVQAKRFPEGAALDATTRPAVARELKIVALAQKLSADFEALETKTAAAFTEAATAAGLKVVNPEGELGPDAIKTLEGIGDETLPLWLGQRKAGEVHFGYPYGGQNFVDVIFLETVTPSRPLSLAEAHDAAVKAWKEQQRDKPARDFRALIRSRARELPEVVEALKPVLEAANTRADEQVAAATNLDDAGKAELRKQILDQAEQAEIVPRIAGFEHLVWKDTPLPEGSRRVELKGVSRAYARQPDNEKEAPESIERFLKTNGAIFRLAVDAISEPLRHGSSSQSAVVEVSGRSFPEKAAMLADPASLEMARNQLSSQRRNEVQSNFTPEKIKASHDLKVVAKTEMN